ncbi:olfactory receptor 14C36-like [Python bivittatus]|uniref:Olfactory receptor 14C36-like n=1 Tax=Python bivittatus TaxID=176946 RepID=A0A9F5N1S3_PYTBI|nr:olfactory receptor 14C36-like [Python bivittatus]
MDNNTSEFLLWEFSKIWELQIMYVTLLLTLYLMTVTGNLLIIIAVVFDHHLHIPMYFFVMNLAMQDIGSVSVIIPKAVFNCLMKIRHISYSGCVAQVLLSVFFLTSDVALLTVMAYDRFVAICNPLQYEMIMNRKACTRMVDSVWIASFLDAALQTIGTFTTPFCSNIVNQFYCEIPHLLKIACSGSYLTETGVLMFSITLGCGCFIFIVITYVKIFSAVLRIPSVQGRKKAFSTCLPHLIVFSVFLFTGCFAYLRPISDKLSHLDFIITILYSIIPAMLNPLIYSMRNKDLKAALSKLLQSFLFEKTVNHVSTFLSMLKGKKKKISPYSSFGDCSRMLGSFACYLCETNLRHLETAHGCWGALHAIYARQTSAAIVSLSKQLYNLKLDQGANVIEHLHKMKTLFAELEDRDMAILERQKACIILSSLDDSFDMLVEAAQTLTPADLTVDYLTNHLQEIQNGRELQSSKKRLDNVRQRPSAGIETACVVRKCFRCNSTKHLIKDCPMKNQPTDSSRKFVRHGKGLPVKQQASHGQVEISRNANFEEPTDWKRPHANSEVILHSNTELAREQTPFVPTSPQVLKEPAQMKKEAVSPKQVQGQEGELMELPELEQKTEK